MFKNVQTFVGRLSEVEKITIRAAANQDRIDWLYHAKHAHEIDLPTKDGLKFFNEVHSAVMAEFAERSKGTTFGRGWAF